MGGCFSKDGEQAQLAPGASKKSTSAGGEGYYINNHNLAKLWTSIGKDHAFIVEFRTKVTKGYTQLTPPAPKEPAFSNPYRRDKELAESDHDDYADEYAKTQEALQGKETPTSGQPARDKKDSKAIPADQNKEFTYKSLSNAKDREILKQVAAAETETKSWKQMFDRAFFKDANFDDSRGVRGHISVMILLKKIIHYSDYLVLLKSSLLEDLAKQDDKPITINSETQKVQLPAEVQFQIKKELECEELDVAIEDKQKELGVTFAGIVQEVCTQPKEAIEGEKLLRDWYFDPAAFKRYFEKGSELEYYFRCINMSIGLQNLVEKELLFQIEGSSNQLYELSSTNMNMILAELVKIILPKDPNSNAGATKTGTTQYISVTGPVQGIPQIIKVSLNDQNAASVGRSRFDNIVIEAQVLKYRDEIFTLVRNSVSPIKRSLQTCLILTKVRTASIRAILSTFDDVKVVDGQIIEDLRAIEKHFEKNPTGSSTSEFRPESTLYWQLCDVLRNEIKKTCEMVYREYQRKKMFLDDLSSCLTLLRAYCLEIIGYYKAIDLVRSSEIRELQTAIQKDTRILRIETKNLLVDLMEDINSFIRYLQGSLKVTEFDTLQEASATKYPIQMQALGPVLKLRDECLSQLIQTIDCTDCGRSKTEAVENFKLSYAVNSLSLVRHDLHYLKLNMIGLFQDRFSEGSIHDIWKCRYKDTAAVLDAIKYIEEKHKLFGKPDQEKKEISRRATIGKNEARDLKELADLEPFKHEPALSLAAMRHSKFMARAGTLAHKLEGRPTINQMLADSCLQLKGEIGVSVGQFKHLEIYRIVLELILEDGLSVKNNREYVLSNKFKKVGFGFAMSEGEVPEASQFFVTFIFAEEEVITKVSGIPENDPDEEDAKNTKDSGPKLKFSDIFTNDVSIEVNKYSVVKSAKPLDGNKSGSAAVAAGTNPSQPQPAPSVSQPNSTAGMAQPTVPGQGSQKPSNQAKPPTTNQPSQAGDPAKVVPVPAK